MLNEKVDVQINRTRLTVEMEGLTPIEVNSLAQSVEAKIKEIERDSPVVDSHKLALMAAMAFAGEAARLQTQHENERRVEDRKLEEMIVALSNGLQGA